MFCEFENEIHVPFKPELGDAGSVARLTHLVLRHFTGCIAPKAISQIDSYTLSGCY